MAQAFRFIHCSDLHLGAPFYSLGSLGKVGDAMVVEATYQAFEHIVDIAIEEHVDAVLIAGDIYNSADHNLEAQVRFVRQLERLDDVHIPVFIVHGNHDPLSAWAAKIAMPKNVYVFPGNRVERQPLVVRDKVVAAIYGMSHDEKGIREDLTKEFHPDREDTYAIGLLHCTVGGTEFEHEYAPTTLQALRDVGMDYWALGHIHKRQVLSEDPPIIYSGNPQGLSRREQGPKGCYLVSVSATGHTEWTFKETDALLFDEATIDISQLTSLRDMEEMLRHKKQMMAARHKRNVLLRITFVGQGPLRKACQDREVRQSWLKTSLAEETNKSTHVFIYEFLDKTHDDIDFLARRHLPDVLGDYLAAYDKVHTLEGEARCQALRRIISDRPEYKRLGSYSGLLTEELLEEAFRQAEGEGALRLVSVKDTGEGAQ